MRRHATAVLFLLWCAAAAQAQMRVKGAKEYAPYSPIVLKAADVTSAKASFLWDVSEPAQTVEEGGTLFVWAPPGSYTVRLTAVDFDAKKVERATFRFTVTGDVPTPPGPTPPGPTPPGPAPPVPAAKGLHVLIVYESADATKLPAAQQGILYGKATRDWLNANCSPWGAIKDWGIMDQNSDLSGYSPVLNALMKRPRASLPWVHVASDGPVMLYEGPLPGNAADMLKLLEKYKPMTRRLKKAG